MYIYYINFEGEQTMNILTRFACAAVLTFAVGAMMPAHADAAAGRFTEAPREVSIVNYDASYSKWNYRSRSYACTIPN